MTVRHITQDEMKDLFHRVGVHPEQLRLEQANADLKYFFLYPILKSLLDRVEALEKMSGE